MIKIEWDKNKSRYGRYVREDGTLDQIRIPGILNGQLTPETENCVGCPYFYTDVQATGLSSYLADVKGICFRGTRGRWTVVVAYDKEISCRHFPTETKKVSFRVRKQYYEMFVAGTKTEELRALTDYWFRMLIMSKKVPTIAVISCGPHPVLYYKIDKIFIDRPENVLGRSLSEQGKQDIKTDLCIVTKMGKLMGRKILPG